MGTYRSVLVNPADRTRRGVLLAVALIAAVAALLVSSSAASAEPTHLCKGTLEAPGLLIGTYPGNVRVEGACATPAGPATVKGNLTLAPGSVVVSAFGGNEAHLAVMGDVFVERGATLLLGCIPTSFPCINDPNSEHPSLSSHGVIGGRLVEVDPLGVIVHNSAIGGSVVESGGGGGVNCNPAGVFSLFGSPVYSDYEDSTIGGNFTVTHLNSCWLGLARVTIAGSARFLNSHFADPDAIEIINNHIAGNLACLGNSMVWDSADLSSTGALYPRRPEPNTVGGERVGQCVLASAKDEGGPLGPGPF